jgi:hypothetical protein
MVPPAEPPGELPEKDAVAGAQQHQQQQKYRVGCALLAKKVCPVWVDGPMV